MKRRTLFTFSFILLLMLLFVMPALADDSTASDGNVVMSYVSLIGIILTTILGTGGITLLGVGALARNIRNDPAAIKAVERLGDSVPKETAEKIATMTNQFTQSMNEVNALIREALDHVPAADK